LAPETYLESACRFVRTRLFYDSYDLVCIGIRSIGSSLSGIVAGALEELGCRVKSITVRPTGHPSNRTVSISRGLKQEFAVCRNSM
jgi:hypothetical protein